MIHWASFCLGGIAVLAVSATTMILAMAKISHRAEIWELDQAKDRGKEKEYLFPIEGTIFEPKNRS